MLIAALVLATLAAALHCYIFWLESFAWTRPATRATFGIASEDDAHLTQGLAFNQGFYNLFLAVIALAGVVLTVAGHGTAGATLVFAGCGSMLAAALVLIASGGRRYARAAATQGTLPALAVALLALSLALG